MVALTSLWLPILLSAVLVFITSALVWTVMPHRKKEWKGMSNEDAVRAVLRGQAPGQYWIPWGEPKDMKSPELQQKYSEGPVGFLTLVPPAMPNMPKAMGLSVVYYLIVGFIVAYIASRTVSAGAEYLTVFRVTGTLAWLGYGFAVVPESIWFGRPWSSTVKTLIEALVYGLLTAGVFGWLWPG